MLAACVYGEHAIWGLGAHQLRPSFPASCDGGADRCAAGAEHAGFLAGPVVSAVDAGSSATRASSQINDSAGCADAVVKPNLSGI
jgi:hypothetical protein